MMGLLVLIVLPLLSSSSSLWSSSSSLQLQFWTLVLSLVIIHVQGSYWRELATIDSQLLAKRIWGCGGMCIYFCICIGVSRELLKCLKFFLCIICLHFVIKPKDGLSPSARTKIFLSAARSSESKKILVSVSFWTFKNKNSIKIATILLPWYARGWTLGELVRVKVLGDRERNLVGRQR